MIGGAIRAILGGSESDHNDVLRSTYYGLADATIEDAKIYIDHIDVDGDAGNPDGVISDVDPTSLSWTSTGHLIIEVETIDGINDDPEHVVGQLNVFQTQGFERLLVASEADLDSVIRLGRRG